MLKRDFKRLRANFFLFFGFALTIGAIWCVYRVTYRLDHSTAFGGLEKANPLNADLLVFLIYFLVVIVYIFLAGLDLEKFAKTVSQVAAAVSVLGFSIVAPYGHSSLFFGTKASIFSFVAVIITLVVLIAIGLLFDAPPPKKRRPDDLGEDG